MTKMVEVKHEDPVIRAFMLFMQTSQAAYKYSDRYLYGSGITAATFIALKGLIHNGGVMNHSELAAWTNTEKHNISSLVDRMKKQGLVTTEYSQVDRRVSHITVTEKGRDLFERAKPAGRKIMDRIMRGVGIDGAAEAEKVLKVMKANVSDNSAG